jgi:hypothetical protein
MNRYPGNYVCASCSQTFTRKSSGERHRKNNNLGSAAIVRFMDYLIGRLEGRYQTGDPSLHRRRKKDTKNQANNSFSLENYKNAKMINEISKSRFTIFPGVTIEESSQYVTRGDSKVDNNETRDPATNKSPTENQPNLNLIEDGIESKFQSNGREEATAFQRDLSHSDRTSSSVLSGKTVKFQEFSVLVQKYYSKDNAKDILTCVNMNYLAGSNWDDWMDTNLVFLRSIHKVSSDGS